MASRFVIILFAVVSIFININRAQNWKDNTYKYDSFNYHLFLPAIFIYGDLQTLSFQPELDKRYHPNGNDKWYCLYEQENGNRVNRYSIGVAVHELPFFLIAHGICKQFTNNHADGYSLPYQWGSIISNIFWVVLGLYFLRKFLRQYFNETVVVITLLAIAFGTNIYYYSVFEVGFSHPYSFMHFAWILLLTSKLYSTQNRKYFYLLSFSLGCIALIRPTDLTIVLIPIFWGVVNIQTFKERFRFFLSNYKPILISVLLFFLTVLPQLLYWQYTAGSWLYYGYSNEGFVWTEPKILEGLFGFRKGWFIYTPIAFISILGLFFLKNTLNPLKYVIPAFITLSLYIIFSWWNWWYGGGFSCRPLVGYLSILAIPLAAVIQLVQQKASKLTMRLFYTLLLVLVMLNMFQSYQAIKNVIHCDRMSSDYYFKVFLKSDTSPEYQQYLLSTDDYYKELGARYNKANPK